VCVQLIDFNFEPMMIEGNFTNFIACAGIQREKKWRAARRCAAALGGERMDLYGVCVFSNLLLSFFPGILFAATLLLRCPNEATQE
jgi:hypothetical protein